MALLYVIMSAVCGRNTRFLFAGISPRILKIVQLKCPFRSDILCNPLILKELQRGLRSVSFSYTFWNSYTFHRTEVAFVSVFTHLCPFGILL